MPQNKPLENLPKERQAMYLHWVNVGRNFTATSRKFGKGTAVIRRMADKDKWFERAEAIECKVMAELDKIITKSQLSNLQIVKALKVKALRVLLDNFKKKEVTVTLANLMQMLEYEDRLLGNIPPESHNMITQIFNGTNGADTASIDRNLGAIFGKANGHNGSAIIVGSPENRLPKNG